MNDCKKVTVSWVNTIAMKLGLENPGCLSDLKDGQLILQLAEKLVLFSDITMIENTEWEKDDLSFPANFNTVSDHPLWTAILFVNSRLSLLIIL